MAQSIDTVVCTELHVMETTAADDDDPKHDATHQQEMWSSDSVEAKEEAFDEGTPSATDGYQDITQADQDTKAHTLDSLLDISSAPLMVAHGTTDFFGQRSNNFLKGCKWYDY